MPKASFFLLTAVWVAGCTALSLGHPFITGQEDIVSAEQAAVYEDSVRPIIEARCTVCHGCYDAPCQFKTDAAAGIRRGAHKDKVYDGTRLLGAELTRLFEDAQTTAEWRQKDFFSVLSHPESPGAAGTMELLLHLKRQHPLPASQILPDSFDFSINRQQQCPRPEEFDQYRQKYPLWGMPYGLPGLNDSEHAQLVSWLRAGGRAGTPAFTPAAALEAELVRWEAFFNGADLKSQLVNRYLYEHLFLASLHFDSAPEQRFKLVRSRTPPGQTIDRISTRRPFDDPLSPKFYYRLWHDPGTVLAKTDMPYRLNDERMKKWQEWFYREDYQVSELPGYKPEVASNPFLSFAALPVDARYRFLLDEAEFTIMSFIKGPVCRGQVALNVIRDHFWVFFVAPEQLGNQSSGQFLRDNVDRLALPAEAGNSALPISYWLEYADQQKTYMSARADYLSRQFEQQKTPLTLDLIWDGDGRNDNAALTIFRHNDSASVTRGLIGPQPKTGWVIDYSLLERIHYLLVAGFDVYGNISHQLLSRLYMDFLRIEGEMNLVALLPKEVQKPQIAHWYRGAESQIDEYLEHYLNRLPPLGIMEYRSDDPLGELFTTLATKLAPVFAASPYVRALSWPAGQTESFVQLQAIRGHAASLMPEASLIWVPGEGVFSLLRSSAHSNLSSLFHESKRRLPEEDRLVITSGIIGAYPNTFWLLDNTSWPDFARQVAGLDSEADYQALRKRYGISRADPNFWEVSDAIHQAYRKQQPRRAALLDFNRLENR